jgi:hypothetical protein
MPNFQGKSIHHLMYTLETQDDVDQAAGSLLFKGRAALLLRAKIHEVSCLPSSCGFWK